MRKMGLSSKLITVYHKVDKFDDYMEILETTNSGYVALEGLWHKKMWIPYLKCIREAYNRGIKVHGFALTNSDITKEFPFYSVDSTTWTNTLQFGTVLCLDQFCNIRQKPTTKKNILDLKIPIDLVSINRGEKERIVKLNYAMDQIRDYENLLRSLWRARGVHWKD